MGGGTAKIPRRVHLRGRGNATTMRLLRRLRLLVMTAHLVIASDRRERRNRIVMATNATTLRLLRRMLRILLVMTIL